MTQESINMALDIVIEAIDKSNIERIDKLELMLNISHFLTNYDEMIKQPRLTKRGEINGR